MTSISPSFTGGLFATAAALSLSISMSVTKTISSEIPTLLLVFMRTLFGLFFFLPYLIKNYHQLTIYTQYPIHLLRVVVSILAMLCTYYTYRHLPLGFATSLGMTGPLFTTLIATICLKEYINKYKWFLLTIGYFGILLIIRPHNLKLDFAIITSLLANIFAGSSIVLVKILSKRNSVATIMSYNNIGICLAAALLSYDSWQAIELSDLSKLVIVAFLGIFTQYFSIIAVRQTSPAFTAPFEYVRLLFSFLIGFFVFKEFFDYYTIIGSLIIIGSTYSITQKNNQEKLQKL